VKNFFAKLDHRGALRICGPDARQFLQGQTTCDIEQLSLGNSLNGAFCNPQGRMLCDFRVLALEEDDLLLLMQADLCEPTLEAVNKYLAFSRAEMTIASADWLQLGICGADAAELTGVDLQHRDQVELRDHAYYLRADEQGQRLEVVAPLAQQDALLQQLLEYIPEQADLAYRKTEIEAGLAHVTAATAGQFLPQMLNYQHTGHLSFSKGCYTGQEVVARMHYKGKVKRPLLLASIASGDIAAAGTALYASGGTQSIGQVVNAAGDTDQTLLLVSVARPDSDAAIHLGNHSGPLLHFLPLPYSLDN